MTGAGRPDRSTAGDVAIDETMALHIDCGARVYQYGDAVRRFMTMAVSLHRYCLRLKTCFQMIERGGQYPFAIRIADPQQFARRIIGLLHLSIR